jgi:hypothetical protein
MGYTEWKEFDKKTARLTDDFFGADREKRLETMNINFGPNHPAAHGVLRLMLELEGEVCDFYAHLMSEKFF